MEKEKKEKTKSKEKAPKEEAKGKKASGKKTAEKEVFVEEKVPVRLLDFYRKEIVPELSRKFNYKNTLQVPRIEKICLNVGVGAATQDPKILEAVVKDIESIVGQRPVITKAKKSVSNFKLREGMKIGCRVTLRRARMYEFLDRLVNVSIPRVRDFRGISDRSFDGRGNYTLGIKEQLIFPEINIDNVSKIFGMDITFVTTAKTNEEALELLKAFGMPFMKKAV
jgi:large subunit ribosomal protein L5